MNPKTKKILFQIVTVVMWVLIATALVSWIGPLRDGVVGETLKAVTSPLTAPFSALRGGGIDFSILAPYFILYFVRNKFLV